MLRIFYAAMVGFGVWAAWSILGLPPFPISGTAVLGNAISLRDVAVLGCALLAYQALD